MSGPSGFFSDMSALDAASAEMDASPAPDAPAPDFTSNTKPPTVVYDMGNAPPPAQAGIYLTTDDQIQVTAWNSNTNLDTVTVQLRMMLPTGEIVLSQALLQGVTSDRQPNSVTITPGEGFLLAALCGPPGNSNVVLRGQCYVTVQIVRGAPPTQLSLAALIGDYLTSGFQPAWPGGAIRSATDGAGLFTEYNIAIPGFPLVINVPPKARWRLWGAFAFYVTSAVVATRTPYLFMNIATALGGLVFGMTSPAPLGIGASKTGGFGWGAAASQGSIASGVSVIGTLPNGLPLALHSAITADLDNKQAGDEVSSFSVTVEEWIDV